MTSTAIVTGATAGIGKATAELLAQHSYKLILTGRREERLTQLKAELESKHQTEILCLCFDIRNQKEVEKAIDSLPQNWKDISILINNAGLAAGLDFFDEADTNDWEQMIDTNIKGLLYISKKVIPLLRQNGNGHIVNIGSIAGKEVYPKGHVYCSTKHAVEAITKGMRLDLLQYGIKVTSVCPGAVETEFSVVRFKGDKQKADAFYEGFTPLYAEDIADAVYYVITRPAHVSVNDILIMPTAQANATTIKKN